MKLPPSSWKKETPDQSVIVAVTPHELDMLTWIARQAGLAGPAARPAAFVGGVSGCWRNGGSDERAYAFSWFKRRGFTANYIDAHEATQWRGEHKD